MTLHKFLASGLLTLTLIGGSVYTLASLFDGITATQDANRQFLAKR